MRSCTPAVVSTAQWCGGARCLVERTSCRQIMWHKLQSHTLTWVKTKSSTLTLSSAIFARLVDALRST